MKRLLWAAICVLAAMVLAPMVLAPSAAGRTTAAEAMGGLPPTQPQAFWRYITQAHPYTEWHMWPGKHAFYPGTRPHGALLTTYVNDIALEAIEGGENPLPPGSIIVKENYDPHRQLKAVTTMYKVTGYDPAHHDWYWVKYLPGGQVADDAAGKVTSCLACHGKRASNDYIWTQPLGKR